MKVNKGMVKIYANYIMVEYGYKKEYSVYPTEKAKYVEAVWVEVPEEYKVKNLKDGDTIIVERDDRHRSNRLSKILWNGGDGVYMLWFKKETGLKLVKLMEV